MEIYVTPLEMWDYLNSKVRLLEIQPQLVADSVENDIEIYVSSDGKDMFYIEAISSGGTEDLMEIYDNADAFQKTAELYNLYIYNEYVNDEDGDDEYGVGDEQNRREAELLEATESFLSVVLDAKDYAKLDDEKMLMIQNNILYALHKAHNFSIYRPTTCEVEGNVIETNYPYALKDALPRE